MSALYRELEHEINKQKENPNYKISKNINVKAYLEITKSLESLVNAKHKSLLLDRWNLQNAHDRIRGDRSEENIIRPQELRMTVMGKDGKDLTSEEFFQEFSQFLDTPYDQMVARQQIEMKEQENE